MEEEVSFFQKKDQEMQVMSQEMKLDVKMVKKEEYKLLNMEEGKSFLYSPKG